MKKRKGFTILLALIITSAFLVVGLGVFEIVFKEIHFSGVGQSSQTAFYAADTGAECMFYWDYKKQVVSTSTNPNTIKCGGVNNTFSFSETYPGSKRYYANFEFNYNTDSCINITVYKHYDYTPDPPKLVTQVDSFGYNAPCGSFNKSTVKRGIREIF